MLVLIFSLLAISFFFGIYVFLCMLFILGVAGLLVHRYPEIYKNRLKNYLVNLVVVLLSFVTIIVIIEVYLHLAEPSFLDITYRTVGNLGDYKDQGYLDKNSFNKPQGTFRILGLGDSFAVSDCPLKTNYHNYLSRSLKAAGYEHTEVLNAGIPGIGPGYYWHVLKKYGDKWQPDLVLLGFFVGNDFEEYDFIMQRGPFIHEPYDPLRRWAGYLQFRNLWLYKMIRGKLIVAKELRRRAEEKKTAKKAQEGTFSDQGYLEIEKNRIWIFAKDKQARLKKVWPKDTAILLKIQDWCVRRKVPLVIAIFPDQFQVDRKLRQEIYQTYHLRAADFDLTYPNGLIVDFCREHRLNCLDLLAPFQKLGASQTLYKLRDSHWNTAGNRLAADLIFQYLTAHRLVGPRTRDAALKSGAGGHP